ncbi:MAG: monovalent cation/H(+) antiporter subunit G [Candidatus Verstraetearchaeota archaeon]|nr:monovalent cation/H(+) antiporter subunit G [Candidatus Verstraetearchaeota archaeon]
MIFEILTAVYAALVLAYAFWNIKRGSFVVGLGKFVVCAVVAFLALVGVLYFRGNDLWPTALALMKIGAAGVLFAGIPPMIAATIGLFRFGDEYGSNIFYVRNHITGIVDTVSSLVMMVAGLLILRIDLAAVGFFFFMFIPFTGGALANSYYYVNQRRSER